MGYGTALRRLSIRVLSQSSSKSHIRPAFVSFPIRSMATTTGESVLKPERVKEEAEHLSNGSVKVNEWSKVAAAFDFRSKPLCRGVSEVPPLRSSTEPSQVTQ